MNRKMAVEELVKVANTMIAEDKNRSYDWAKFEFHANQFSKTVSEIKQKVYDGVISGEQGVKIVLRRMSDMKDILK